MIKAPSIRRSRDPVWLVTLPLAAVWAGMLIISAWRSPWDHSGQDRLIELGALSGQPAPGEWHRVITSSFLHLDWLHLLPNLGGLLVFGWLGVRLFGLGQAALAGALATLAGGLAPALMIGPDRLVVGASGCVFGLAAFALCGLLRQGLSAPIERWRTLLTAAAWALCLVPAAISLHHPAQLAGLLAGLPLGLSLPLAPMENTPGFRRRGRAFGGIAAVLMILPWMWHLLIGTLSG